MSTQHHSPTEILAAFRELELTPDADLAEVISQHKNLAYVWDPDRLPEHLREAAAEKLQRVNHALDVLSDYLRQKRRAKPEHRKRTETERRSASGEETGSVRRDEGAVRTIAAALLRVLTEGGNDNFVILYADDARNYYAQFATEPGSLDLYGEVVGNAYLQPQDRLRDSSIRYLEEREWTVREGENFYKEWHCRSEHERAPWVRRIAAEIVDIMRDVYGIVLTGAVRIQVNLG